MDKKHMYYVIVIVVAVLMIAVVYMMMSKKTSGTAQPRMPYKVGPIPGMIPSVGSMVYLKFASGYLAAGGVSVKDPSKAFMFTVTDDSSVINSLVDSSLQKSSVSLSPIKLGDGNEYTIVLATDGVHVVPLVAQDWSLVDQGNGVIGGQQQYFSGLLASKTDISSVVKANGFVVVEMPLAM